MARKPGITAERHVEIGEQLTDLRAQFAELYREVMNAYPARGARGGIHRTVFREAMKSALHALDEVKNQGDNASLEEWPREWEPHWYYPGVTQEERDRTRLALMEKRETVV